MARIAVVGAGGIGATFGGQWLAGGHDVVFCARRPFSRLIIRSASAPVDAAAHCVIDPADLPARVADFDWLVVAVKTHQVSGIRPWLDRLITSNTRLLALQNGLESDAVLSRLARGREVTASVVYCGAESTAPGRVRHSGGLDLVVPAGATATALAGLSAGGPIIVRASDDFITARWRKVLVNTAVNGPTALARRPMGIFGENAGRNVARALLAEGVRVARADGARLDGGDIDRILADLGAPAAAGVAPSMLQDRLAARATEADALYGAVSRAAERHGVEAPLHRLVGHLLAAGDT